MTIYEMVLYVLSASEERGVQPGRTMIQKLTYFVIAKLDLTPQHTAYHYGPYSVAVSDTLRDLTAMKLVEESTEDLSYPWEGEYDTVKYEYALSDRGKRLLEKRMPKELKQTTRVVNKILDAANDRLDLITFASKVHFLRKWPDSKTVPSSSEIIAAAKDFGWALDSDSINKGEEFLRKIDL